MYTHGSMCVYTLVCILTFVCVYTHANEKTSNRVVFDGLRNTLSYYKPTFDFLGIYNDNQDDDEYTHTQRENNLSDTYTHTEKENNFSEAYTHTQGSNFLSSITDTFFNWANKETNFYSRLIQQTTNTTKLLQYIPGFNILYNITSGTSTMTNSFISAVNEIRPGFYKISTANGEDKFISLGNIEANDLDKKILEQTGPAGATHISSSGPREFNEDYFNIIGLPNLDEFLHINSYPKVSHICQEFNNWLQILSPDDPTHSTLDKITTYRLCNNQTIEPFDQAYIVSLIESPYILQNDVSLNIFFKIPNSAFEYSNVLKYLTFPPSNMKLDNPFSSKGAWPVPHGNSYCNAASTYPAPDGKHDLKIDTLFKPEDVSNSIFLFYSNNNKYLWGTSWFEVFKIERSTHTLNILDTVVSGDVNELINDIFHGAYSVLTAEENLIVPRATRLSIFHDDPTQNGQKIVKSKFEYSVQNDRPNSPPQYFLATVIAHNGDIVWVTRSGLVGVNTRYADEQFTHSKSILDLSNNDTHIDISNSIAADLEGGIYIVTSKYMHKVNYDGYTLTEVWRTEYALGVDVGTVRLGQGSGSTPSLMGPPNNQYVVISDDSEVMNVLAFDAHTGVLVATHPITFGDTHTQSSMSEQSLLVSGWRVVVVNNAPTHDPFSDFLGRSFIWGLNNILSTLSPPYYYTQIDRVMSTIKNVWPVIVGDAPKGVEQLQFDPYTHTFQTTWISDISIPNGIPTMSTHSGLMYGIGKRGYLGVHAAPMRGMWTLEAIDWWTGQPRFHYNIGLGPYSNSLYAATQIGPNEIISGTIGGIVRIYEANEHIGNSMYRFWNDLFSYF